MSSTIHGGGRIQIYGLLVEYVFQLVELFKFPLILIASLLSFMNKIKLTHVRSIKVVYRRFDYRLLNSEAEVVRFGRI